MNLSRIAPLILSAAGAASPALASEVPGYLDLGYVDSEIEAQDPALRGESVDGNGFMARLLMPVGRTALVHVDYQDVDYDDVDSDISILRSGLGFRLPVVDGVSTLFRGEYISTDIRIGNQDISDDGLGGTIGVHVDMNRPITGWFNYSYFAFDESDGNELEIGMDVRFTTMMAMFLSYRALELNPDNVALPDIETDEFRVGLRLWYDAGE